SELASWANEESTSMLMVKVTATTAAAVTNHFSWRRSSPRARLNLRARVANEAINATGMTTRPARNGICATAANPVFCWFGPNGFDQLIAAQIIAPRPITVMKIPMAQATGRHRLEESDPVGNKSSRNIRRVTGMVQIQFETQARARPAGREPGSAFRACRL